MNDRRKPIYTDEVAAAMRAQGLLTSPEPEPELPPGQVHYFAAIDTLQVSGTGTAEQAAAMLRQIADQITTKEGA